MALPQRRDPYEDRELREVERNRNVDTGGGWFLGWWWLWLLVIICAFWFVGWGWGGYGGWWWGRGPATARPIYNNGVNGTTNAANLVTGDGLPIIEATDKQAYIGKNFQIRNVPVQSTVDDHALWISANGSTPMLVILAGQNNSLANAHITNDSRVDITGTVEKAPPTAEAKTTWNLDNNAVQRLEQEGAYVSATQVQKVQ